MASETRTALTIAGSDSGGGAGVQADLKTFAALGVYGLSAITAVTAQNTRGVTAMMPVTSDIVTAQIEAVTSDVRVHAVKTGMLVNAAIVEAVAAAIESLDLPLVVVDPVMASTSGFRLLDDDGIRAMCAELLPRAYVVTPNIPEAELLSGLTITSVEDARAAATEIHERSGIAVVVKGGHRQGETLVDLLFDGRVFTEYETMRIEGASVHGTGCAFASAIAAGLAKGASLPVAVADAQSYVARAIERAHTPGRGHRVLGH